MSEVLEGEYKGNAMLIIRNDANDKFPFNFGLKKARLILAHFDAIEAFVRKHSK